MGNPFSPLGPADYQVAALNLLPRGDVWPRDLARIPAKFFSAIADLFAHFHFDTTNIVDVELNPGTTSQLLSQWEAEFGLPDPCVPQPQTIEQRRTALIAKITELGGLSRQHYIALAASLGFAITITEFRPITCLDRCIDPIIGVPWRFLWQVNAPATTVSVLTCLGDCVSPLRSWGNAPLECLIGGQNRPSRFVLFSYS